MSKEKILLFSSLIVSFLLLELFLRFTSKEIPEVTYDYKHVLYKNYTEQELSRNIPLIIKIMEEIVFQLNLFLKMASKIWVQ